jgi:hypothetical protein
MIRAGRLVHQGSVAELRATQQKEFLIAPEHDSDRDPLAGLLRQADCSARRPGDGSDPMIRAAFTSEWTKLSRKTLLLSTFLGLAAAASLFVILMFSQAAPNGGIVTLHQLARPNGLVIGLARASMLLGVAAFGIAASQVASEYSLGTLRQLQRRDGLDR